MIQSIPSTLFYMTITDITKLFYEKNYYELLYSNLCFIAFMLFIYVYRNSITNYLIKIFNMLFRMFGNGIKDYT